MDVAEYRFFVIKEFSSIRVLLYLCEADKPDGWVVNLASSLLHKSEQPETRGRDFLNIIAALCWKWPYFTVPSTPFDNTTISSS